MAGAITFTGLGSNFDSNAVIDGLVAAEKIPIQALNQHKSDVSSQLSILAGLVSKLQALGDTASDLSTASTISSVTANSADETRVKVSATGAATAASHTVVVNKLAQAQTSISKQFLSRTAPFVSSGTLTITSGANPGVDIQYDSSDSLDVIAARINQKVSGVSASVIADGKGGFLLSVSATKSGAANAVTFDDAGAAFDMTDAVDAQDADVKIDGVSIKRSSNTIGDVVSGVTFSLVSVTPTGGAATSVTVATDVSGMQSKVQRLVDAFNAVHGAVAGQLAYTGTTRGANTLFGDSGVLALNRDLGAVVSASYKFSPTQKITSADIGISLDKTGVLSLDATKFADAVAKDPQAVQRLLIGDGSLNGGLVHGITKLVTNYTDFQKGVLVVEQQNRQKLSQVYDDRIQRINDQADTLEQRLRSQFAQLDQLMATLNSQQSYITSLSSQLNNK